MPVKTWQENKRTLLMWCPFNFKGVAMSKEWARPFYTSKSWKKCRQSYIDIRNGIDGGMCEECHEVPGYIVHHKVQLTPQNINNADISLSHSNLKYVCKHCHDVIHGYCEREKKKSRVRFDENGNPSPPGTSP
jgi:hypothetical protein